MSDKPFEIQVRYEPDHEALTFDEDQNPFLTWGRDPFHGNGWQLWYVDADDGVEQYFIPGDLTDVEAAIAEARKYLEVLGRVD